MDNEKKTHTREEKLEAGSLTENSKFLKLLDNFWYHYKWHTIIGGFFAAVLIVGLVQLFSRPAYDTMLVSAGGSYMTEEEKLALDQLWADICPEDFNGDGEKKINFVMYQAFSAEELQKEKESVEAAGEKFVYDANFYAEENKNFTFFTQTGEGAVCVISPYLYQNLVKEERLRSITSVYGSETGPVGVVEDGCGVKLGETDLYKFNPAAHVLPEDWVICLLKPTLNADDEAYAHSEQFFRAIVDYRVN